MSGPVAHVEGRCAEVRLRRFGALLAVAAVFALSACTSWRPTAAEVDGSTIGTDQVGDLSDVLRRDQAVTDLIGSVVLGQADGSQITDARTVSDVSLFLLSQEIIDKVIRAEVARRGLTVSDELRQSAWNALGTTPEEFGNNQPGPTPEGRAYIDRLVEQLAVRNAYLATVPEDQRQATVTELFARADISVNPRFGRWDPAQLQVVPLSQQLGASSS